MTRDPILSYEGFMSSAYKTSDLALASYLMMKELKLISASRVQGGRFEFIFDDPNQHAQSLAVEYVNSDFCRFDNHVRNLKKIIYKN